MPAVENPPAAATAGPAPVGPSHAVFRWGARRFAVGIDGVQEVITGLDLTPLPRVGGAWLGVANLRGEILPAVSLGTWFPGTDASARPVFLVLRTALGKLALAADRFEHIAPVPPDALEPAPAGAPAFVTGRWVPQDPASEQVLCMNAEGLARNLQDQFTASFSAVVAP